MPKLNDMTSFTGPYCRESADERREREAERYAREIEAVADALSEFWDLGTFDWDDDAIETARECSAWLHTMPARLRERVLWRIEGQWRRAKVRPSRDLTVLGKTFRGEPA